MKQNSSRIFMGYFLFPNVSLFVLSKKPHSVCKRENFVNVCQWILKIKWKLKKTTQYNVEVMNRELWITGNQSQYQKKRFYNDNIFKPVEFYHYSRSFGRNTYHMDLKHWFYSFIAFFILFSAKHWLPRYSQQLIQHKKNMQHRTQFSYRKG